jgi:hypothetical protein
MLEDFRGHDPNPTVHERAWIETNPFPVVFRVAVMAAIALVVGLSVSNETSLETPSPVSAIARTAG